MIRTPRLLLRRARMSDLDDLHRIFADPRAMRYWDTPPHTDIEPAAAGSPPWWHFRPDASDDFVLERDGRVIGKAGCWRIAEIGFILHPDHWRQGLASEALAAALPHIFATLPVAGLTADVDPRNAAALRAPRPASASTKPIARSEPFSVGTDVVRQASYLPPAAADRAETRDS